MAYKLTLEALESITDAELAFGTVRLLPAWDDIPDDFKRGNDFTRIASAIFFGSPMPQVSMVFKPGFDGQDVPATLNKCVRAHLKSFQPKHEHKIAGVGVLMAQTFGVTPDAR